jgi:hypothetical protein
MNVIWRDHKVSRFLVFYLGLDTCGRLPHYRLGASVGLCGLPDADRLCLFRRLPDRPTNGVRSSCESDLDRTTPLIKWFYPTSTLFCSTEDLAHNTPER